MASEVEPTTGSLHLLEGSEMKKNNYAVTAWGRWTPRGFANLLGFAAIAMPNSLTDPSSDQKLTFSVTSHKSG